MQTGGLTDIKKSVLKNNISVRKLDITRTFRNQEIIGVLDTEIPTNDRITDVVMHYY